MRNTITSIVFATAFALGVGVGCTPTETRTNTDFAFDGTCVNCHAGLSAGHVHKNFKLRCVDCHGGDDQQAVDPQAFKDDKKFRDPKVLEKVHVKPQPGLARFFFANGIDDDGDGVVDNGIVFDDPTGKNPTKVMDLGENWEPGLHGEGSGEFLDTELNRDLNYTRFLNPGDLRVATISCGGGSRGALEGFSGGACHQQTIDMVRRSIMVNQAAVTNGAYYGNESDRFTKTRDPNQPSFDLRTGAFGYALDYDGPDNCIDDKAVQADISAHGTGGRIQPKFDSDCMRARVRTQDPNVSDGAQGNQDLPAFEIAQGTIRPTTGSGRKTLSGHAIIDSNANDPKNTLAVTGAGDLRLPWGGHPNISDARGALEPLLNGNVLDSNPLNPGNAPTPDPVDVILRTFRAYYPLNYPGSTNNFNFTFGTSIDPEQTRFKTQNPFGRGHSSGCSACHAPYNYDGSRNPTPVLNDDGTVTQVVDPTTKHREFDAAKDDHRVITDDDGVQRDHLVGRPVKQAEQVAANRPQQKTYSANHSLTAKVDTDTCGLCHGFVTRINYAYQGMSEDEQRNQLSRRHAISFKTPGNKTTVNILDSWVREDNDVNFDGVKDASPTVIIPEGTKIVELAKKRDADLAARGFIAGNGGCAQATFTEDCNNNGELDTNLTLERKDENGVVIDTVTINEDLNGNGQLDLIDRLPRERSIDGRQVQYIYGGRNGSTRQMDIHFQMGMHCIDCHFQQDVHGDGHVYSTNWDNIEIECEDCHGTSTTRATLRTSGPNGGNDLTLALNDDRVPFFERSGGRIIQRSRVTPGLQWDIVQTQDILTPSAVESHNSFHVAEQGQGSEFEGGMQGQGKMTSAKVECATCHGSWILNCVGCHVEVNTGDPQRNTLLNPPKNGTPGTVVKSAGENEVWLSNHTNRGHINFQLLGLLRSPLVLGSASLVEQGRLAPFRSSMQAHASLSDDQGELFRDNLTFTTFQMKDANSGRMNVATSGVAMNQTMPHTVRPVEARGCENCHSLVNEQGQTRNEHIIAQTYGIGTGALPFVGDWVFAVGNAGAGATSGTLELFEYKQEKELAANNKAPNAGLADFNQRFPGLIVNGQTGRVPGRVEPLQTGVQGNDVVMIRNFNKEPVLGGTQPPTTRDLAVIGQSNGTVQIVDVSLRGHRASTRPGAGNSGTVTNINIPGATTVNALAHIGSDVSDPYVFAATGAHGLDIIKIVGTPGDANVASVVKNVALPLAVGEEATAIAYGGDVVYVGTSRGIVHAVSLLPTPEQATLKGQAILSGNPAINHMQLAGFLLYAATSSGTTVLALDDIFKPGPPAGSANFKFVPTFNGGPANGLYVFQGTVFVAVGGVNGGVQEIDYRTPSDPADHGNVVPAIAAEIGQAAPNINAADVIVSRMPGQVWLLVLGQAGDLFGLKLDNRQSLKEKCFPDPAGAGCLLDMEFRDYTQSGRDPSWDPGVNPLDLSKGRFDLQLLGNGQPFDPSANPIFHLTGQILANGQRMARPTLWEQLNTLTGRRYRDSFMPGSGTISLEVMQNMRNVQVCETGVVGHDPSGLNDLGYFVDGSCVPFGASMKPRRVCRVVEEGQPSVCRAEAVRIEGDYAAPKPVVRPGQLTPSPGPWRYDPPTATPGVSRTPPDAAPKPATTTTASLP